MIWLLLGCASAAHPDTAPECAEILRDLRGDWRSMYVAASPARTFHEDWSATPAGCRGGTWYLLAARELGLHPDRALSTADGVKLTSGLDALERGLVAEPDHGALLAFVAFGSAVTPELFPALPADACARVAGPSEDAAYVCGMAALREGRFEAAIEAFDRVRDLAVYPDGPLRRQQAYVGAGREVAAVEIDPAQMEIRCLRFGATPAACPR